MRESCLTCTKKHIAEAIILWTESKLGYPENKWLAVGHLAESEAECVKDFQEIATKIRSLRLRVQEDDNEVDLLEMIREIERFEENAK